MRKTINAYHRDRLPGHLITKAQTPSSGFWLWVTGPDFYFEEDGSDRICLEPSEYAEPGEWWTCRKDTSEEDLILLYRTAPQKDIAYLIKADSNAYELDPDEVADKKWRFGCDHRTLCKFQKPLTIEELRSDPVMRKWGPLQQKFRRSAFPIAPKDWQRLMGLLAAANPSCVDVLADAADEELLPSLSIGSEASFSAPTSGGGFGDPETNKLVESSAIEFVTNRYRSEGWEVESVEENRRGYDLKCTKGKHELHIEVKGISGDLSGFIITAGEVKRARNDPYFILCVVAHATAPSAKMYRYTGNEFLDSFDLNPIQFRAVLRT